MAEAYWRGVRDRSAFVRASAPSTLRRSRRRIPSRGPLTVIPTEAVEPWILEEYRTTGYRRSLEDDVA